MLKNFAKLPYQFIDYKFMLTSLLSSNYVNNSIKARLGAPIFVLLLPYVI